ncbi:MAG: hypothetical protein ACP5LP_00260 [Candidatus Micrarchaeia archaeon]
MSIKWNGIKDSSNGTYIAENIKDSIKKTLLKEGQDAIDTVMRIFDKEANLKKPKIKFEKLNDSQAAAYKNGVIYINDIHILESSIPSTKLAIAHETAHHISSRFHPEFYKISNISVLKAMLRKENVQIDPITRIAEEALANYVAATALRLDNNTLIYYADIYSNSLFLRRQDNANSTLAATTLSYALGFISAIGGDIKSKEENAIKIVKESSPKEKIHMLKDLAEDSIKSLEEKDKGKIAMIIENFERILISL